DDGKPGVRQITRQSFRRGESVGSRTARADHSKSERSQQLDAAARIEQDRRIENLAEQSRVTRVAQRYQRRARFVHLLLLCDGVLERAATGDVLGHGTTHAGVFQFGTRCAEDRLWCAESIEQLSRGSGA